MEMRSRRRTSSASSPAQPAVHRPTGHIRQPGNLGRGHPNLFRCDRPDGSVTSCVAGKGIRQSLAGPGLDQPSPDALNRQRHPLAGRAAVPENPYVPPIDRLLGLLRSRSREPSTGAESGSMRTPDDPETERAKGAFLTYYFPHARTRERSKAKPPLSPLPHRQTKGGGMNWFALLITRNIRVMARWASVPSGITREASASSTSSWAASRPPQDPQPAGQQRQYRRQPCPTSI